MYFIIIWINQHKYLSETKQFNYNLRKIWRLVVKENNSTISHGPGSSLAEIRITLPPASNNPSIRWDCNSKLLRWDRINQAGMVASKAGPWYLLYLQIKYTQIYISIIYSYSQTIFILKSQLIYHPDFNSLCHLYEREMRGDNAFEKPISQPSHWF